MRKIWFYILVLIYSVFLMFIDIHFTFEQIPSLIFGVNVCVAYITVIITYKLGKFFAEMIENLFYFDERGLQPSHYFEWFIIIVSFVRLLLILTGVHQIQLFSLIYILIPLAIIEIINFKLFKSKIGLYEFWKLCLLYVPYILYQFIDIWTLFLQWR